MTLSARGLSANKPLPVYIARSFASGDDSYHPSTNPDGYINLAVAENLLSLGSVASALSQAPPIPRSNLNYGTSNHFRGVLARFLSTHITGCSVRPEHVAVVNGAGSAIDMLAYLCCDEGDKVLTTGPGYRGLDWDVWTRARAVLVTAALDEVADGGDPVMSVEALEQAWVREGGDDSRIKMVIICSPNNPTGEVLSEAMVRDIVAWGRQKGVHMVFDELYAKSVYDKDVKFFSVGETLGGVLGDDVHVVWSFSKDFCISGTRMGVLYSQNDKMLNCAGGALAMLAGTSRHSQWAIEHMLGDEKWVKEYFATNAQILLEAYKRFTAYLERMRIPYMPASAGFFLWIDLREWMAGDTAKDEMDLWEKMYNAKVILTPASECFARRFGFFRVCFAAVDQKVFELGWERLASQVLTRS